MNNYSFNNGILKIKYIFFVLIVLLSIPNFSYPIDLYADQISDLIPNAIAGDTAAQSAICYRLYHCHNADCNKEEACFWCEKAAKKGDKISQDIYNKCLSNNNSFSQQQYYLSQNNNSTNIANIYISKAINDLKKEQYDDAAIDFSECYARTQNKECISFYFDEYQKIFKGMEKFFKVNIYKFNKKPYIKSSDIVNGYSTSIFSLRFTPLYYMIKDNEVKERFKKEHDASKLILPNDIFAYNIKYNGVSELEKINIIIKAFNVLKKMNKDLTNKYNTLYFENYDKLYIDNIDLLKKQQNKIKEYHSKIISYITYSILLEGRYKIAIAYNKIMPNDKDLLKQACYRIGNIHEHLLNYSDEETRLFFIETFGDLKNAASEKQIEDCKVLHTLQNNVDLKRNGSELWWNAP